MDFKKMSNFQLNKQLREIELKHEALKKEMLDILDLYDKKEIELKELENEFKLYGEELNKRLS